LGDLQLIVGLGNPGREYRDTRHNAGFMLLERLAQDLRSGWRTEKKFFAELADGSVEGRRWLLCRPQTFMNLSGESVGKLMNFHRLTPAALLVVVDDADLPLGTLRMRPEGSSGGHHGLDSIEQHLGTRSFARLKLGIARPASAVRDIAGHVLGKFAAEDLPVWEKVLERGAQQVRSWSVEGIGRAMNRYNGPVATPVDQERKRQ